MNDFAVGQRWMSAPESELGLGIVSEVSGKRVTLLFLACNERRVYAMDNAPLTRVRFVVGDKLETEEGWQGIVTHVQEQADGIIRYQLINDEKRSLQIDEMVLSHALQFNKPQDKLFLGQAEAGKWFSLRYETWRHIQRLQQSEVQGLLGARVSLIPHQIYIAHEVARRASPRVMLADEVGLGKTIEAGLILQHRLHLGLSARIMIMAPESLLHQWLVEMLRRFNLAFSLFDEARCQAIEGNPFQSEQLVLCGLGFFEQNPHRKAQAIEADWDIVVVDEAHHLEWDTTTPSEAYLFVEKLAKAAAGLILLTATPEQLGKQTHFAQLRLLDSDRFYSLDAFLAEEAAFEPVAQLAESLVNQAVLSDAEQQLLATLVDTQLSEKFLRDDNAALRQEIIEQLVDRHGTGRILFRNSRQTIQGFPQRQFYEYPLTNDAIVEIDAIYLDWLVTQLQVLEGQQVLLICQQAETVIHLQQSLRNRHAIQAAAFHEGMSIIERDRAAAYFADPEMQVQILLCSEIGSEGRNFQFVHHLILFDLPENPDLLQQRIGRLDRIGQQHIIQIHVPYIVASKQHSLCRWYAEGLSLFQANSNVAGEVYRQQQAQLKQVCASRVQEGVEALIQDAKVRMQQVEQHMQQARDVLLELNSCRQDVAEQWVAAVYHEERPHVLSAYMDAIFECFGVESEYHSQDCSILTPGQLQRVSHFPYVPADGVTVTVNRQIALAREDMQYLTWEHPMVVSAMDLVLSDNIGNAALSVVKHPELAEGRYFLECLFLIECSAPAGLQLSRFLPATPIRVLIDQERQDLSAQILHEDLSDVAHKLDTEQITAFIGTQRQNIDAMLLLAEQKSALIMQESIAQAATKMMAVLAKEIKRLRALSDVNASIKPAEIEQLKERALASHEYIHAAQLRLDAVRFIISS